ncbi:MAG: hypothetical protein ABJB12_13380 [Pseudomonadota bacterium]
MSKRANGYRLERDLRVPAVPAAQLHAIEVTSLDEAGELLKASGMGTNGAGARDQALRMEPQRPREGGAAP